MKHNFSDLPGGEFISQGLNELENSVLGISSLLLLIAAPRLRNHGILIPDHFNFKVSAEDELYNLLRKQYGDAAYQHYNALVRRLVSLENALDVIKPTRVSSDELRENYFGSSIYLDK